MLSAYTFTDGHKTFDCIAACWIIVSAVTNFGVILTIAVTGWLVYNYTLGAAAMSNCIFLVYAWKLLWLFVGISIFIDTHSTCESTSIMVAMVVPMALDLLTMPFILMWSIFSN